MVSDQLLTTSATQRKKLKEGIFMSNLSKLRVSKWSRFCAAALLAITPEYYPLNKIKKRNQAVKPSFEIPTSMPLETAEVNGVKVRYAQGGNSSKPTLILLSPLPQSVLAYAPLWKELTSEFHVFALDMPGFGHSEGGKEYMTFEMQGLFLKYFIEFFKIRKPHIVGPDVGMAAALYYAGNFQNEIESLIIGDGPGVNPSKNGSIINKMVKSRFWRVVFDLVGAETFIHAGSLLGYGNYSPNQEEIDDYVSSYSKRVGTIMQWFKNYPEGLSLVDSKLESINVPVQIFWGDNDKFLLPENAQNLHNKLKYSKLHIFKECGHFSYQDKHGEFGKMIHDWVLEKYSLIV